MAAIDIVTTTMPNVYDQSWVNDAELQKLPDEGEREVLEQEGVAPDLATELRVELDLFAQWLQRAKDDSDHYPCGHAFWRKALNDLPDARHGVTGTMVWEFCCRILARPEDSKTMGTSEMSQLLLSWWFKRVLHEGFTCQVFTPEMLEDLQERGKTVETRADEENMRSRWLRLAIQGEVEAVRDAWLATAGEDVRVDIDVEYAFQEPDQACLGKETEAEAARLIQAASIVAGSEPCNAVDDACQTSAHASGSCDHTAVEPKSKGVDVSDRGHYTYGLSDGDCDLASDAAGDMAPGAARQRERVEPTVSSETDTFVFDCRKLNSIPKEEVQWVHDDL